MTALVRGAWGRGMHHDGGDWYWIPMVIVMLAVIGLIVWLLVAAARRPYGPPPGFGGPPSAPSATGAHQRATAEEILAERLARGEIEVDDYHRRLEALRQQRPPQS